MQLGWRMYLGLACLGLGMALVVGNFQPFPGYMDADYYFAGGLQLVGGKGFTESYLWNYLGDPGSLPTPSHSYWMPLASVIAAAGMWLTGRADYVSGRLGFVALAAAVPVVTAALAFGFSRRPVPALISGLLAVFSVYYVPFLPVPDNYGVYLILGAVFLLAAGHAGNAAYLIMGATAGLMTLARSDGILWLGLVILTAALRFGTSGFASGTLATAPSVLPSRNLGRALLRMAIGLAGFLLVLTPWLLHSSTVHGRILPPGGDRLLWLTSYDDIFAYPASQLTMQRWLGQGLPAILSARLSSLRWNLLNAFAAQGGVFLFPFILIGAWNHRRDLRAQVGIAGWSSLLLIMTVLFPFVGARGGFFHAGAAFQSLWWVLAPLGMESLLSAVRKHKVLTSKIQRLSGAAMVGVSVLMSVVIFYLRVLLGWGEGEDKYPAVEAFLVGAGAQQAEVAMVRNPPGYYIMTGRPAIVVPYADATGIVEAARRYNAKFLIIEAAGAAGPIRAVYDDLTSLSFEFIGELDGTRVFRIQP